MSERRLRALGTYPMPEPVRRGREFVRSKEEATRYASRGWAVDLGEAEESATTAPGPLAEAIVFEGSGEALAIQSHDSVLSDNGTAPTKPPRKGRRA